MSDALKMLSIADLEALQAGDMSKVSTRGLEILQGSQAPASVTAGKAINRGLADIPRQVGLTARYGLEGLADLAQVGTEPVANLMRMAGIPTKSTRQTATALADAISLPSPESANERVIGDATRMVAGAAGGSGLAKSVAGTASDALQFVGRNAAPVAQSVSQRVGQGMAANPLQQISAAAGAGLAGGSSREAGGNAGMQAVASLVGGIAGGMTPNAINSTVSGIRNAMRPNLSPQELDIRLTSVLGKTGANFAELPDYARNALRSELRSSLQANKELDPNAVRRLADFLTVRGVTPTRGMVTQDPVQITREMNLAKIGANSADGELQGLAQLQNRNNTALISRLNDLGAGREVDPLMAGRAVQDRIQGTYAGLKSAEQQAWDAAKGMPGYTQPVFPDGLNAINRALGDDGMMGFLNPKISEYMAAFQTGQQPFTPQAYRNLQSMLSGELAKGGNEAAAARIARNALESTPLKPITQTGRDIGSAPVTQEVAGLLRSMDAQPQSAIDAINAARAATRAQYGYAESSPLVRTVLGGSRTADPEKVAQSFILNGTLNDAKAVAKEVGPDGLPLIRDALVTYIKKQAVSGASDEVGKVSQSALNSALRKIGDEKLKLFFSAEEITQLKSLGRVASYMQNQPVGSAVNNSNSGALVLGRGVDVLDAVAKKLPFGQSLIADPLRNINISLTQRAAQNIQPGLLAQQPNTPTIPRLLLPGLAVGGGLLAP